MQKFYYQQSFYIDKTHLVKRETSNVKRKNALVRFFVSLFTFHLRFSALGYYISPCGYELLCFINIYYL